MVIAGELSLTGEIRPVRRLASRIKTATNLGFDSFLGPTPDQTDASAPDTVKTGVLTAPTVKAAVKLIYGNT
jgi:DNA repair protein RadA/Sms